MCFGKTKGNCLSFLGNVDNKCECASHLLHIVTFNHSENECFYLRLKNAWQLWDCLTRDSVLQWSANGLGLWHPDGALVPPALLWEPTTHDLFNRFRTHDGFIWSLLTAVDNHSIHLAHYLYSKSCECVPVCVSECVWMHFVPKMTCVEFFWVLLKTSCMYV